MAAIALAPAGTPAATAQAGAVYGGGADKGVDRLSRRELNAPRRQPNRRLVLQNKHVLVPFVPKYRK